MGFKSVGRAVEGYNTINDQMKGAKDETSRSNNFLTQWITDRLPDVVTNLAIRVVDDGSGTVAKEVLDAGQDKSFLSGLFK